MYELILSKVDALSASLGLGQEDRRVRQGDNPWGYSGGAQEGTLRKGEEEEEHLKEGKESDVKSVYSTSTMVEKTEVGHA
jgi:sulfate adenylyltransferase subunit 1 (EFTu-like GTPase family)